MAAGGTSVSVKVWSLFILTLQNALVVLTLRYTRTLPGDMYLASTAVMITELLKAVVSVTILFGQSGNVVDFFKSLYSITFGQPLDAAKMLVPACIYTVQNNLLYIAVSNLDAATYQVTYQLKILTTALFSVVMLKKSISKIQWFSLFMLFVGVSVVQLQPVTDKAQSAKSPSLHSQNPVLGLAAVVASSLCSGFAGVYFEKIVKGTRMSLWARNFQLALFSIIIGTVGMYINDGEKIRQKGILFGYHKLVWLIVGLQAFGGILVGFVVKYTDNILKGFSAAISIVVSCIASVYLFQFKVSIQFVTGAGLVMLSTYLYGIGQSSAAKESKHDKSKLDKKVD
ncbi:UDP-galactose translocator-like [Acropora millepora]|uniref:UDP-galactose translocator-like n=1 Tax=Acropora millepora TaxID=45264 RepID=UPI001CF50EDB|nr:UDP-galactose translocator-like [Acropora millepora]